MSLPAQLYQLLRADQDKTWLDPVIQGGSSVADAVLLTVGPFRVPTDRVLVLEWINLRSFGFGAEEAQEHFVEIFNAAGTSALARIAGRSQEVTNSVRLHSSWTGSTLLPPGSQLQSTHAFGNAVVGNNSATFHFGGILIPVGNIQHTRLGTS